MRIKRHRYRHPSPSPRVFGAIVVFAILSVGIAVAVVAGASSGVLGEWEAYDQSVDLRMTDGRFSWTTRDIDGKQIGSMEGTYRATGGGKYRAKVTRMKIDSADQPTKGLLKHWQGHEFDIRLEGGELLIAFLKDDTPIRYRRK